MTQLAPPPPRNLTDRIYQMESQNVAGMATTTTQTTTVNVKLLAQEPSAWFADALRQIRTLTTLPRDWDTYGAEPINALVVADVVNFLVKVAVPGIAQPSIVPLADGGLQIEWHRGGLDVEVTFSEDEPGLFVLNHDTGEESERPLSEASVEVMRMFDALRET